MEKKTYIIPKYINKDNTIKIYNLIIRKIFMRIEAFQILVRIKL